MRYSYGAFFRRTVPAIQIYGANTGVGKTVVATLLGKAFAKIYGSENVAYLKPVSTGPDSENDAKYVKRFAGIRAVTLFQFRDPVSPHIAARAEGFVPPTDGHVLTWVSSFMNTSVQQKGVIMVESAGGVLSPGPSGTMQADLFRPLRLPVVLVGDHRLGGIATTMSAAESLTLRGYDLVGIVIPSGNLGNFAYLNRHFSEQGIPVHEIPLISNFEPSSGKHSIARTSEWAKLKAYYTEVSESHISVLARQIRFSHARRVASLDKMSSQAAESIWHPFTQHKDQKPDNLLAIDSAHADFFQIFTPPVGTGANDENSWSIRKNQLSEHSQPDLRPAFDGSASWWTQGLGHGNRDLALAAAYAAGRYGHVMFAGAIHEPALTLAKNLIKLMDRDNKSRLRKVFFTDDGSTGVEVGIKMALKASSVRYGWDGSSTDIGIIGLKGSYHGDTIGAMDCSEPSTYNKKVEWYRGRGYWFDYPQVKMKKGKWTVEAPTGMEEDFGQPKHFETLQEVFNLDDRDSSVYERYINNILKRLIQDEGRKFGALVMEPVLLGAGGMILVDPLFQRTLARVIRASPITASMSDKPPLVVGSDNVALDWTGLPVVFDEVFTGMYRLGQFSSSVLLDTHADVSVHAKLLTGGLLPLCVTMASQSIFNAFLSDEKSDALLHGHSYTAHAVGCHIANVSMNALKVVQKGKAWKTLRESWIAPKNDEKIWTLGREAPDSKEVWSMWSKEFVTKLSHMEGIDGVVAIGSVLAITLVDESGAGYTSNAAIALRDKLLRDDPKSEWAIHSRVLGNVFYLMASMTSSPNVLRSIQATIRRHLGTPAHQEPELEEE